MSELHEHAKTASLVLRHQVLSLLSAVGPVQVTKTCFSQFSFAHRLTVTQNKYAVPQSDVSAAFIKNGALLSLNIS